MHLKSVFEFVTRQLHTFDILHSPPGWIWNGTTPPSSADPYFFGITQTSDWVESNGRYFVAESFGDGALNEAEVAEGEKFAGRKIGGQGGRERVFGNQFYGSEYPDNTTTPQLGVAGKGFPFAFYPVVYAHSDLPREIDGPDYLYTDEYGAVNTSDRPGGPLVRLVLESDDNEDVQADPTWLEVIADNFTITTLEPIIQKSCNRQNTNYHSYVMTVDAEGHRYAHASSALQYYRGSSAVLLLHPYNNTDIYNDVPTGIPSPPRPYQDLDFINCVNLTIGTAIPLATGDGLEVFHRITESAATALTVPYLGLTLLVMYLMRPVR